MSKLTAEAHGCSAIVSFKIQYPPTINHENCSKVVEQAGKELLGEENVSTRGLPVMASEDFSYYMNEIPGCFFFINNIKEG